MELAQWDVQQRLWLEEVQALGFRQVGVGKLICESWKLFVKRQLKGKLRWMQGVVIIRRAHLCCLKPGGLSVRVCALGRDGLTG